MSKQKSSGESKGRDQKKKTKKRNAQPHSDESDRSLSPPPDNNSLPLLKGRESEEERNSTDSDEELERLVFECDICGRRLSTKWGLKTHIAVHTEKKPFQCQVCGKRFARKSNMRTHIKVSHDGIKPFECQICQQRFGQKGDLSKHLEAHSRVNKWKCPFCDKMLATRGSLKGHLTGKHKMDDLFQVAVIIADVKKSTRREENQPLEDAIQTIRIATSHELELLQVDASISPSSRNSRRSPSSHSRSSSVSSSSSGYSFNGFRGRRFTHSLARGHAENSREPNSPIAGPSRLALTYEDSVNSTQQLAEHWSLPTPVAVKQTGTLSLPRNRRSREDDRDERHGTTDQSDRKRYTNTSIVFVFMQ